MISKTSPSPRDTLNSPSSNIVGHVDVHPHDDSSAKAKSSEFNLREAIMNDKPYYAVLICTAFITGIMDLGRLAVNYLFKDDLHFSPAQMSLVMGFISVPWFIKPIYGFITDTYPIGGLRRQPYFLLCGLIAFVSYYCIALANASLNTYMVCFLLLMVSTAMCFISVLAEALIVEKCGGGQTSFDPVLSKRMSTTLMTLYWGTQSFAKVFAGGLSGYLLEMIPKRDIFIITGSFALLLCILSLTIREGEKPATAEVLSPAKQMQVISAALKQRIIWGPMLFVFLWAATPSSSSAFFFFLTNDLNMEPRFMGWLMVVEGLSSVIGLAIYQLSLKDMPYRKLLLIMMLASVVVGSTPLILILHWNRAWGIDDRFFAMGDTALLAGIGQIATMPLLVIGARNCPPNVEATLYSFLMSSMNFGGILSEELGGVLTLLLGITQSNFTNLWVLVLICNLSSLLPTPLLHFIDEDAIDKSYVDGTTESLANVPDTEAGGSSSPRGADSGLHHRRGHEERAPLLNA